MSSTPRSEARLKAENELFTRQRIYKEVLNVEAPQVQLLLEDLAKFCRAHESTFHEDPRAHALAEGRREVWLRIQNHLELKSDKLWELYTGTRY